VVRAAEREHNRENRPELSSITTAQAFTRWYWLKSELLDFCRANGLRTTGNKPVLSQRIEAFLRTGKAELPAPASKPTSTFDWQQAPLTLATKITDNYKNTRNVRHFIQSQTGKPFRFSIAFMQWMKDNQGKTLQDAIDYWHQLQRAKSAPGYQSKIPPGNEYNQYVRDFMRDNPDKTLKSARECWLYKKSIPGTNRYHREDVEAVASLQSRADALPVQS